MYSFHSSPEEKNKLLFALTQHGIETTVDRIEKKKRIRDWIQESVIQEDDEGEEEEDDDDEDEDIEPQRPTRVPVAGHVSSVRAEEKAARTQINTTVKDAANKHINPRTGKVQQGPSEMGHHSNDSHAMSHHNENDNTNQINHTKETRKENNGHRRSTKLVDVGSQTSSESQKQLETANQSRRYTPERTKANEDAYAAKSPLTVSTQPHQILPYSTAQYTQTNSNQMEPTPRGFLTTYNAAGTVPGPDMQQAPMANQRQYHQHHAHQTKQPYHVQPQNQIDRDRNRSYPRQSYQQRHNTTALTKHPLSRSIHNMNNIINDSGYGSLDKLRPVDGNTILASPTFTKRSIIQMHPSNGDERIHINGLSHTQNESHSPFHSDSGGDDSAHGSNGFVNLAGSNTPTEANRNQQRNRISMKDTAYDRARKKPN